MTKSPEVVAAVAAAIAEELGTDVSAIRIVTFRHVGGNEVRGRIGGKRSIEGRFPAEDQHPEAARIPGGGDIGIKPVPAHRHLVGTKAQGRTQSVEHQRTRLSDYRVGYSPDSPFQGLAQGAAVDQDGLPVGRADPVGIGCDIGDVAFRSPPGGPAEPVVGQGGVEGDDQRVRTVRRVVPG